MRATAWVGCLAGALGLASCDEAIYGAFLQKNPNNCLLTPAICRADEVCDPTLARCVSPNPRLSAVEPSAGPTTGGTELHIAGSGFTPGCRVSVDGVAAETTFVRGDQLTALAPAQPGRFGKVPISVDCGGELRTSAGELYSYYSGTIRLSPLEELATGDTPQALTSGDFDGDGHADLAVLNGKSASVSLIFSGPAGSQKGRRELPTSVSPHSIAAGDVNGDGAPDLVVTDSLYDVSVYLNKHQADGSFATPSTVKGLLVRFVALVDLNLDGKLDIVGIAGLSEPQVALGQGDGSFVRKLFPISATGVPRLLLSGDLNGDQRPDLVFSTEAASSLILMTANADGSLAAMAAQTLTADAPLSGGAIIDATDDGIADLVVSRKDRAELAVYAGTGTGTFKAATPLPAGLTDGGSVVAADLNQDGKVDLAVADPKAGVVNVLHKTGLGTYTLAGSALLGSGSSALVTLDWDRDGRPDLATLRAGSNLARVLRSMGARRVPGETAVSIGPQLTRLLVSDLTGDGVSDCALLSSFTGNLYLTIGDGSGGLSSPVSYALPSPTPSDLAVGDLTSDGKPDLLVNSAASGRVHFYRGDGQGKLVLPAVDTQLTTPSEMAVAKLDGDGTYDVAVAEQSGLTILLGDGKGGLSKLRTLTVGTQPFGVAAADFNKDGKTDLAVFEGSVEEVRILLGDGAGGYTISAPYGLGMFTLRHEIVDLNGDGNQDIVTSSVIDRQLVILLGDGTGKFNTVPFQTVISPDGFGIADLDGDGRLDVVVGDAQSPTLRVLRGGDTPLLSEPIPVLAGSPSFDVAIADLDKDGRPDVVGRPAGSEAYLLRNLSR